MKTVNLIEYFNSFCSDGEKSFEFLKEEVIPLFDNHDKICFNFEGIRNMNSSFSNALFSNMIRLKGKMIIKRISFINCNDNIKVLISSSVSIGLNDKEIE